MSEEKDLSMSEKLDLLIESQVEEKKKKDKKFRMPLGVALGSWRMNRQPYAIIFYLRTNGQIDIQMKKIEDDTVKFGEYIYEASSNSIWRYKRKPVIILKEWDMKPLTAKEEFQQAVSDGTLTAGEKLIITKMQLDAIKKGVQVNWLTIGVLIIVAVGGLIAANYYGLLG